jgi:hypothetical protein
MSSRIWLTMADIDTLPRGCSNGSTNLVQEIVEHGNTTKQPNLIKYLRVCNFSVNIL